MISKNELIEKANALEFADIGFTTADAFEDQKEVLQSRKDAYAWAMTSGLDLIGGTDPKQIFPEAQSIIVLLELYFGEAYPPLMEAHFGRCYLDDDRVTKDGLARRIKAFRSILRDNGIDSKVPFNLPHRLAAARAGLGTFGKNCLFYSNKVARQGSWVLPIAVVVDHEFAPNEPTIEVGCPDWCKSTCIIACPTGALQGPRKLDPRKCISYLTYYGDGLTPLELREPMGLYVYGCDRCQEVCPRNKPWLSAERTPNPKVAAKAEHFQLPKLLHMDKAYFKSQIWPHMFYMSVNELWRWQMNTARVMGNTLDPEYIPDLIKAFQENPDERVRAMCAWALGRIGTSKALDSLNQFQHKCDGIVLEEVRLAKGL